MIGYVTLGTNNFDAAVDFYDELFESIGAKRVFEAESFIAWGKSPASGSVSIAKPFNGEAASVGNGVMVAIGLRSPDEVDAFHAKALELGGSDEGAAGPRGDTFHAGYFRDLDGNKLNAFCFVKD
jgi:catechol 2,3-dioxygenase-like lactoylglutathione lyase family enzyme